MAVGDECFIQNIQQKLSGRILGRSIVSKNGTTSLQESPSSYSIFFRGKNGFLSTGNTYLLQLNT